MSSHTSLPIKCLTFDWLIAKVNKCPDWLDIVLTCIDPAMVGCNYNIQGCLMKGYQL